MTEKAMSSALYQAAQQIEGRLAGQKRKGAFTPTPIAPSPTVSPSNVPESSSFDPKAKKVVSSRSRALRLEQNRKAARESRRRKKAMIEELQRSLVFFSKSNAALKEQNELLSRQVLDAYSALEKIGKPPPPLDPKILGGFSSDANETKDESMTKVLPETMKPDIGLLQPGATMQAMANFQQAAQAAMEAASRTMKARGVVLNPDETVIKDTRS